MTKSKLFINYSKIPSYNKITKKNKQGEYGI